MYDSLISLEPILESIPADLVGLMLTATKNISFYSGYVKEYPYPQLLVHIRYFPNYKYSRFNYDQKTNMSELMTEDSSGYYFLKNKHHVNICYGLGVWQESIVANEKLPLYQLIRYSEFLETRNVLKLEIESSTDEKVKYRVKLLWEMLSKVYACDEISSMLKLVDFWTEQHFFDYQFGIKPLHIEAFELLLNQELRRTIAMQADSIYLNKAIIQSNLSYIVTPVAYRRELLKILCECFSDTNKLLGSIEQYVHEVTALIELEFGKAKAENILALFTSELILTNRNSEKILDCSTKTAIGYLKKLEEMNLLQSAKIRNKIYYFNRKIVSIINRY